MQDITTNLATLAPAATAILLPGYVWVQVERNFICRSRISRVEQVYSYVLYSLFSYTLAYSVVAAFSAYTLSIDNLSIGHLIWSLFLGIFLSVILGATLGICKKEDWLGSLFGKLGVSTVHPYGNAWDKAFSMKHGCVVRVSMSDGSEKYGVFGPKSLVSTEPAERDLFLEATFFQNDSGGLELERATRGIWLPRDEVACIRFYSYEELCNESVRQPSEPQLSECSPAQ